MMRVSEIFGSVQGEGRFLGRPSTFLRLAGCNLQCWWCDSAYTWRFSEKLEHRDPKVYSVAEESHEMSLPDVFRKITSYTPSHLVITGGEPLLQPRAIETLLKMLTLDVSREWSVEFETAGTRSPVDSSGAYVYYTVSPKLLSSGNSIKSRRKWEHLRALAMLDSVFKFVVCSEGDITEADDIVRHLSLPHDRVYLMAEGTNAEDLNRHTGEIQKLAYDRGYRLTTRLQVLMYGNRRGV